MKIIAIEVNVDIEATPVEIIVWILEVFFIFLLLIILQQYVFKEKKQDYGELGKIAVASALIVIILPAVGVFSTSLTFDGRSFYAIGVVIVFAVTAIIIHKLVEDKPYRCLALTTLLLVILYSIRIIFDVALVT